MCTQCAVCHPCLVELRNQVAGMRTGVPMQKNPASSPDSALGVTGYSHTQPRAHCTRARLSYVKVLLGRLAGGRCGEATIPQWAAVFYYFLFIHPWGSPLVRPTGPLQEYGHHFKCHRNCSENDLPQISEARKVLKPLSPRRLARSSQGSASETRNVSTLCTICILKREISKVNLL